MRTNSNDMEKKILILNGSPRKKGNTSALVEAFTEGAKASGNIVTTFFLDEMNIHGCKGCFGGGKNHKNPCVQKDDMINIYPEYENADIVVLASPMYYWGVSGQLKCTFDRLFAVAEKNSSYSNPKKQCILLMASGDSSKINLEPVVQYYHSLLNHLGWSNLGEVFAGDVLNIGDIKGHIALNEAKELGLTIT